MQNWLYRKSYATMFKYVIHSSQLNIKNKSNNCILKAMQKQIKHPFNCFNDSKNLIVGKCQRKQRQISCASRIKNGKAVPSTCKPNIPQDVENVQIGLVKQNPGSSSCKKNKSFKLIKKQRAWQVEVSKGCRGVFKVTYQEKCKF